MIAQVTAKQALRKVGISTNSRKKGLEAGAGYPGSRAAPRYMTDAQALALKIAGEQGWVARKIVADAKKHTCAVSIEKEGEVAWIASDGSVRSEDDIVKGSGAV